MTTIARYAFSVYDTTHAEYKLVLSKTNTSILYMEYKHLKLWLLSFDICVPTCVNPLLYFGQVVCLNMYLNVSSMYDALCQCFAPNEIPLPQLATNIKQTLGLLEYFTF